MTNDHDASDPHVTDALTSLPRTLSPSADYTDRVLAALTEEGLVRAPPWRARRLLVAAAWFLAGVGTGAAALGIPARSASGPPSMLATSRPPERPAEPVEWY